MGVIYAQNGTVLAPSHAFQDDTDTGWYRIGANSPGLSIGGVKAIDITATQFSFTGANSTSNTTFTVENTSNAAAASHAIIEAKVGGTTSTGDPQLRLTIPSGTSHYLGVDNSAGDTLHFGTGTTVGGSAWLSVDIRTSPGGDSNQFIFTPISPTVPDAATSVGRAIFIQNQTTTFAGQTQVTTMQDFFRLGRLNLAQSGGALTVNKAAGIAARHPVADTSVTLTESAAYEVEGTSATGGTITRAVGLLVRALTLGTTNPQILLYNGSTEHTTAVADSASISCIDLSAGNASFSFTTEHAAFSGVAVASTHKWGIRINGTLYYVLLSNV